MKKKIKKFIEIYIEFVQKKLIFLLLLILYIVGFGLTRMFVIFFKIRLFVKESNSKKSFWENTNSKLDKKSFFLQI